MQVESENKEAPNSHKMAPDLNSIPTNISPSAHPQLSPNMSTSSSRRPSHTTNMPPPPAGPLHTSSGASMMTTADSQIPIRHPRPLTAAELHLELEKEQEAVVNRLTRELSALRAQHSASVASNASHSSTSSHQTPSLLPLDDSTTLGSTHPTPSRQRRSSSSASSRSIGINTPSTSASSILSANQREATASAPLGGVSQASADRAAAAGGSLSRNPSVRSSSGQSTPARPSIDQSTSAYHSLTLPHRPSISNAASSVSNTPTVGSMIGQVSSPGSHGHISPLVNPTQYYSDAAAAKAELELVKEENEALRQRVRSLEQALKTKRRESQQSQSQQSPYSEPGATRERSLSRPSPQITHAPLAGGGVNITSWAAGTTVAGPRERSESQSTTASTRRALTAEDREDSIRVGESAANTRPAF